MHNPPFTTLITVEQLKALLDRSAASTMVFDCSFDLMKPEAGAQLYAAAHIPGAQYANLDTDLSAKHGLPGARGDVVVAQDDGVPASGGRHPLPSREKFAAWLSSVGFSNTMQAVVYDRNGANYCGRLWWMLKWMGHDAVAVLDGGLHRVGETHRRQPGRELLAAGQRMAPARSGHAVVLRHHHVAARAGLGLHEVEAAVEHPEGRVALAQLPELFDGDEGGVHGESSFEKWFGDGCRGCCVQCSSAGAFGTARWRSTVAAMPLAMISAMPAQPAASMRSSNSTTL